MATNKDINIAGARLRQLIAALPESMERDQALLKLRECALWTKEAARIVDKAE